MIMMMNILTFWQSLVNKTHHYQKQELKNHSEYCENLRFFSHHVTGTISTCTGATISDRHPGMNCLQCACLIILLFY